MPIDNLSKITSRTGISTTILLEAGNVNATGIITAAGFNGPFTGGGAIAAGIITGTGLEISGVSTFTGDLSIADKIIHTGNTNCFISFPDAGDQIVFEGGGHERFRINGTTGKYLFGRDITGRSARYNNTGVVPTIQIEDDTEASFSVAKFSNNTDSSRIYLQKGRGSTGSAAVVQDNDTLGMIVFNGYNGSGFRNAAQILAEVDGEPTTSGDNTDMPGALVFKTSADGTSAPAERLRITSDGLIGIGTAPASGTTLDIDASGGGVLVLRRSSVNTSNKISLSHDGTNGTLDSTNDILFRAGGGEKLRITSGGDVGIGSDSTGGARLRVYQDGTDTLLQQWRGSLGSTAGERAFNLYSPATDSLTDYYRFQTGNAIKFEIDSIDALCIKDNGNLGIGTDDPSTKLQIVGSTSSADSSGGTLGIRQKGDTNNDGITLTSSHANSARIYKDSDGALHIYNTGGSTNDFVLTNGGNVGIGSMTPGRALTIQNSEPRIRLQKPNQGHGEIFIDDDNSINLSADSSSSVGTSSVIFRTNGSENVRIKETKVGIGISSPSGILDIREDNNPQLNLRSASHADDGGGRINFAVGVSAVPVDGNTMCSIASTIHSTSGGTLKGDMKFYTNSGDNLDERMVILSSGKVGIGTNDPQARLDVLDTSGLGILSRSASTQATDTNKALKVRNNSSTDTFNVSYKGQGYFAGKVGIGTDNPDTPLHIVSDANNMLQIESTDRHSTLYLIDSIGSSFIQNDSGQLRFGVGGGASAAGGETEAVRIDSNRKVGIGTVNPAVRLDVRNDSGADADTEPLIALHHSTHDVDGEVLRIGRTDLPTIRYHSLFSEHSGGAASNTLKFYMHDTRSASSTRQVLTLQGNGRVGIGTTNGGLDAALEVTSDEGAFIKSFTNAVPARVRFSDHASSGSYAQQMTIDYRHSDNTVVTGANEGLHIYGSETISAVRIDGVLRITEQPCAVVYQATGPGGGAANAAGDNKNPIHFDHVHINQGGMTIANDNARITVPVTGNYLVSGLVSGTVSNIDTNDGIELVFLVDGSEYPASNSGIEPVFNFGHGHDQSNNDALTAHTEYFCSTTTILSLSENDYIELAVDNIGCSDASVNRGHLSVALLN